eukprot:514680_1
MVSSYTEENDSQNKTTEENGYQKTMIRAIRRKTDTEAYAKIGKMSSRDPTDTATYAKIGKMASRDPQCDRKGCANTRRTDDPDREVYLCEGCKKKRYCSKHCQKLDWGEYPDRKINKNSPHTGSHRDDKWCPHTQNKTTEENGYQKTTDTEA